ncbi:unnamed protein product [Spirodela intermedia]|uniref:COX assembly mitochondrial protein n=2 Tax=Spirodela intermedia TaxID=51605 RepID=A0A7I8IKN4_SPIIN|nr:unnamed protein product [Spirodela intermedia]CAA6658074.1 unnamed protein product [Spirodela intermedia]CAA7394212.1 unnamed protein product [Spirodela intermedia]
MLRRGERRPATEAPQETAEASLVTAEVAPGCGGLHRALAECHRRARDPWLLEAACRHLNRALADCLVEAAAACSSEAEATRILCSSAGTAAKRAQCRRAEIALSACLSSLQSPP